jgi:hypothetical protein
VTFWEHLVWLDPANSAGIRELAGPQRKRGRGVHSDDEDDDAVAGDGLTQEPQVRRGGLWSVPVCVYVCV